MNRNTMAELQQACEALARSEKPADIRMPEGAVILAAMQLCGFWYNAKTGHYELGGKN